MSDNLLEGRWGETKDALLEGLQGSRRTTMASVLENTKKHLVESAQAVQQLVVTLLLLTELFFQ